MKLKSDYESKVNQTYFQNPSELSENFVAFQVKHLISRNCR